MKQYRIRGSTADEILASAERGIRDGSLAPGDALPTVRGLATELSVSPTTVAAAYRELRSRGLVVAEGRRGTRVSAAPPVATGALPVVPAGVLDLAAGNPDPALLPDLAPALTALARSRAEPHLYAEQVHLPELLERARADLSGDRLPSEHLSVVSGALDGIERALTAHLRPGDRVAVEDPGYLGVLHLLRAMGLVLEPVDLDDSGPLPASLERALAKGARACVLTPRAQNPTGAALDAAREKELCQVLAAHPGVLVVEDDHAGSSAGIAARSLCRAADRPFAVVRSVSKTLGPDLRLAVLSGDAETVARIDGRQALGTRWVSHLLQRIVVELWSSAGVRKQLERAARVYGERREALLAALAERGIEARGRSGLNVWVPVASELPVVQQLLEAGYAVRAGEAYRLASPPALRITTAALDAREAARVADALADALRPAGGRSLDA